MSDISVISISWILSKIEFIFRICTHSQSEIVWRWILCGEINQRHHPLFTRKYFQKWHQQSTRNNKNEKQEEKKKVEKSTEIKYTRQTRANTYKPIDFSCHILSNHMAQRTSSPCIFTTTHSVLYMHCPRLNVPARPTERLQRYIFIHDKFYFCLKLDELRLCCLHSIHIVTWKIERTKTDITSWIRWFLCDDSFMMLKFILFVPFFSAMMTVFIVHCSIRNMQI